MSEGDGHDPCPAGAALPASLRASRRWSEAALARLRLALGEAGLASLDHIECIAAAGSLARGEAGPASDVDCVIVASAPTGGKAGGGGADAAGAQRMVHAVLAAIEHAGLRAPGVGGFFRQAVSTQALLDARRLGAIDEDPGVYGKRLQLLLDTRPLLHDEAFRALRDRVLHWFTFWQPAHAPLALLASELVRYRRSYWAYQYYQLDAARNDATEEPAQGAAGAGTTAPPQGTGADGGRSAPAGADGWRLRYAKLQSSRLITVAGLLALIGEASRHRDAPDWVVQRLELAPLQRLVAVMQRYERDARVRTLLRFYARVHEAVEQPAVRAMLAGRPVADLEELAGKRPSLGASLDEALEEVPRRVNDFFLARRADWAPWFYAATGL